MNASLKLSYSLLAPIYDVFLERASRPMRQYSLAQLQRLETAQASILIDGIGSGLDIPLLPAGPRYTGIDLTPGMLRKARIRAGKHNIDIQLQEGNSLALPFPKDSFDVVIMHLILAVVPNPVQALLEAERVLKPNGYILILDKFLRPGQLALVRRLLSPVAGLIATNTNVVFERVFETSQQLQILEDKPMLANGWFRHILLQKQA